MMDRRTFLKNSSFSAVGAVAVGAGSVSRGATGGAGGHIEHIASNVYPWMTFYGRENRRWGEEHARDIADVASTGSDGFEPIGSSPGQITKLAGLLRENGLEMRSLYVNSKLHEADEAVASIDQVLAVADAAGEAGAKIVVTNPSPIRWGGDEDKSDDQLREQAGNLDLLGEKLRRAGLVLAYHNHDAELRQGGREFHHMLTATDPENVKLCLDSHWVFRGCGDSQVALFDAVSHYSDRIVELHLRQSTDGVWTEVFDMAGDIDYRRLFALLGGQGIEPHLVLEQAVEAGTPKTLDAVEAHRRSQRHLRAFSSRS